jgi:hypothetical protein
MIKKLLYLITGIIILSSCYSTHDEHKRLEPDNLIDREKMVLILADVEIAESALRQKQNVDQEIGGTREVYFHTIFKTHDISRAQYDSSLLYYKQDPKTMDKIYEDVSPG